jgi:hypothetical protein
MEDASIEWFSRDASRILKILRLREGIGHPSPATRAAAVANFTFSRRWAKIASIGWSINWRATSGCGQQPRSLGSHTLSVDSGFHLLTSSEILAAPKGFAHAP